MIDRITAMLEKNGVTLWRITERKEHCAELYFIRKKLDMPRIKDSISYSVDVFVDFEENDTRFRGNSTALISSGMTDDEISGRIVSAKLAAGFVKNPWFELAEPVRAEVLPSDSPLAASSPEQNAIRVAEIMFSADRDEDAFLNSVEIFATHCAVRIIGFNGLDVGYEQDLVRGELVAQCVTPADVEQFREFGYDRIDEDAIRVRVTDAIADVRARAAAVNPPKSGTYDILLTGEHVATLMEYYTTRSHASLVCAHYSDWQPGTAVQGDKVTGEKLNLSLKAHSAYSTEGIPLIPRDLLVDGELKLIHGSTRFCRYAGVEPTGDYETVCCSNGSVAIAEMRSTGVLEPVSFSDFQMDPMDGHFKGEIRLALLHRADGTVERLTGGSVNGSLPELQHDLTFSKERYDDLRYEGPLGVLIHGVAVAGV